MTIEAAAVGPRFSGAFFCLESRENEYMAANWNGRHYCPDAGIHVSSSKALAEQLTQSQQGRLEGCIYPPGFGRCFCCIPDIVSLTPIDPKKTMLQAMGLEASCVYGAAHSRKAK
ncbi:hypothetical protein [Thiolapillus sp.]